MVLTNKNFTIFCSFYTNFNKSEETDASDERTNMLDQRLQKPMEYNKLCMAMDDTKTHLAQVQKIRIKTYLLETIMERIPQSVVLLTIILAGVKYPKLLQPLMSSLQQILNVKSTVIIILLVLVSTFFSIAKSVMDYK